MFVSSGFSADSWLAPGLWDANRDMQALYRALPGLQLSNKAIQTGGSPQLRGVSCTRPGSSVNTSASHRTSAQGMAQAAPRAVVGRADRHAPALHAEPAASEYQFTQSQPQSIEPSHAVGTFAEPAEPNWSQWMRRDSTFSTYESPGLIYSSSPSDTETVLETSDDEAVHVVPRTQLTTKPSVLPSRYAFVPPKAMLPSPPQPLQKPPQPSQQAHSLPQGPQRLPQQNPYVPQTVPQFQRPVSPLTPPASPPAAHHKVAPRPQVSPEPARKHVSKLCLQPAKTGYALWVGNLAINTTLMDLRALFGTPQLQSIYLIQRTGCAFVNYDDGPGLDAAIAAFNSRGGKIHGHELVIKPQRVDTEEPRAEAPPTVPESSVVNSANRFFICKSLTVDDLEVAKETGRWSTQLRNMERFNSAFFASKNTYLVFSANRTSSFYGFARLDAPFEPSDTDQETCISCTEVCEPEIVETKAFFHPHDGLYVPPGETVLDPLRGSQFWKVENCVCVEPETEKWTAPAPISWISSHDSTVPFLRTRQLKNSLNQNKPIKVARDGTEIDPQVGQLLCGMFD